MIPEGLPSGAFSINSKKAVTAARAVKFAKVMKYPSDQFVVAAIEDELREAGITLRFNLKKAMSA